MDWALNRSKGWRWVDCVGPEAGFDRRLDWTGQLSSIHGGRLIDVTVQVNSVRPQDSASAGKQQRTFGQLIIMPRRFDRIDRLNASG
jgi:hypothetical protein